MTARQRMSFLREFGIGFGLLIIFYFFTTGFRNIREDFGAEIYSGLKLIDVKGIFTRVDIFAGFGLFVALSLMYFLTARRWGAMPNLILLILGTVLLGSSTIAYDLHWLSGMVWMILVSISAYLMVLPADTLLFDRLIARYRIKGTAVFMAYIMDSIGYTGTVCIYLYREFVTGEGANILSFFRGFCYFMAVGGCVVIVLTTIFFINQGRKTDFDKEGDDQKGLAPQGIQDGTDNLAAC